MNQLNLQNCPNPIASQHHISPLSKAYFQPFKTTSPPTQNHPPNHSKTHHNPFWSTHSTIIETARFCVTHAKTGCYNESRIDKFLSPSFQIGIGEEVGVETGFFRSVAALLLEVLKEAEGVAA